MTPAQVVELKIGDWINWSPNIWAQPIYGEIVGLPRPGEYLVEWEDGHTSVMTPDRLVWSSFSMDAILEDGPDKEPQPT